jgi:hypothetical protein
MVSVSNCDKKESENGGPRKETNRTCFRLTDVSTTSIAFQDACSRFKFCSLSHMHRVKCALIRLHLKSSPFAFLRVKIQGNHVYSHPHTGLTTKVDR